MGSAPRGVLRDAARRRRWCAAVGRRRRAQRWAARRVARRDRSRGRRRRTVRVPRNVPSAGSSSSWAARDAARTGTKCS